MCIRDSSTAILFADGAGAMAPLGIGGVRRICRSSLGPRVWNWALGKAPRRIGGRAGRLGGCARPPLRP
eukprot:6937526-Alexandrium_andersonii.AAC.1